MRDRLIPCPDQLPVARGQTRGGWIGQRIREGRNAAGLSQRELAAAAGVSVGALRDIEQGRTASPRWGSVAALARVLRLDAEPPGNLTIARRADVERREPAVTPPGEQGANGGRVQVGILGPLVVTHSGQPIGLGPARHRAVLGLLALSAGAGVRRDELIELLWPGRQPAMAANMIQGYVSRLRGLTGPAGAHGRPDQKLIIWTGRDYRLGLSDEDAVDSVRFRRLARRGHAALADAEFAMACGLYERALNMWRGSVLDDVELLHEHPLATPLNIQRSEVTIRYADAAALTGAHHRVLPHLRDLCGRERLNEPAHAQLIIALAATGQRSAAIAEFEDLKWRLDRELGIDPGQRVARAYSQITGNLNPPTSRVTGRTDGHGNNCAGSDRARPAIRAL